MNITSTGAQVEVRDNTDSTYINIHRCVNGYGAEFWAHKSAPIYLVRKVGEDDTWMRLVMVPSDKWLGDMRDAGYEIVGKLSDLLGKCPPSSKKTETINESILQK